MTTTYWDLPDAERAKLTADDVDRFVAAELMLKGVLKVKPLELVPEPDMPAPDRTVFVLKLGYHTSEIAFATADKAAAALANACALVGSTYVRGYSESVNTLAKLDDKGAVQEQRVYSEEMISTCRQQIEKAVAARAENDRRRKAHAEAAKVEAEALKGLWDDWHGCRAKAVQMQRIAETFAEYTQLAGNAKTAAKFLRKAFPLDEITDAAAWCGFAIDRDALTAADAEMPKAEPEKANGARQTEDIPF